MSTTIRKKIDRLEARIEELDKKSRDILIEKRECLKQKQQLEQDAKFDVVKNQDLSVDELNSIIELGKLIKQSGLSKSDIQDLISEPQKTLKEEIKNENT